MGEKIIKAKDFMTKYVFSIPPDVTVHELVKLFVTHPVSAVPVVGDDNELLGIVSEGDLLYKKVKPKGTGCRKAQPACRNYYTA